MLVTSKEMLQIARKKKFAVPAANFFDCLSAQAHVEVAEELQLPLILEYAESHAGYLSLEEAAVLGKFYAERAKTPVVLHFDHGVTPEKIKQAVDSGFTSVMIDASQEPLAGNIAKTKEIIDYAHPRGVAVEAEIGHVGTGITTSGQNDDSVYTSPEEAAELVHQTGVDSLAISIGTAHGAYAGKPVINFQRLEEIAAKLDIPLVLHGGSSSGDDNLSRCAISGISKINIFTDFVLSAAARMKNGEAEDYFKIKSMAKDGIKDCLRHYYSVFHTEKYRS